MLASGMPVTSNTNAAATAAARRRIGSTRQRTGKERAATRSARTGQRDEQRHDAPYRPFVRHCRMHVHVHTLRSPAGIIPLVAGDVD